MKILLVAGVICIGIVPVQHQIRGNRVWTLEIVPSTCNITLHSARSGIWDYENGKVINLKPASPTRIMYQWTVDIPINEESGLPDKNYRAADFAEEMAQTIYIYELYGKTNRTKSQISYRLWVSPLGLSDKKIPPAPQRQFINGNFDADDRQKLNNWFINNHKWSVNSIWRDFDNILYKFDPSSRIELTIGTEECINKSIANHLGFAVQEVI